jgi:UDP-glucuronate 4-epimerase
MALFLFTKAILENRPIDVFNFGNMQRDFTYVDDIVEGIVRVIQKPATCNENWDAIHPDSDSSSAPYRIYNIGNSAPVSLMEYIEAIENKLGKKAEKNLLPLQPGDVTSTYADTSSLQNDFGYKPATSVKEGVSRFIDWYLSFFQPKSN